MMSICVLQFSYVKKIFTYGLFLQAATSRLAVAFALATGTADTEEVPRYAGGMHGSGLDAVV